MNAAGPLVATALFLAFSTPAVAAKAKPPAAPSAAVDALKHPMVFFRAKGEPNACGSGCNEWIAAEGVMASGTTARMRTFLKREGGKRPIYFNSPGGITSESISMGRLMRERGMTARVARTIPKGCAEESRECAAAKRSGRELPSKLISVFSQCNAACVYAIVGARTREIAPEAHFGIHASRIVIAGHLPKNMYVSPAARMRFKEENQQRLRRYLADMGIQTSLLDAAEKIPHESIRALNRDDMVRFNIDIRRVVESGWIYDDRLTDRGGIFKSIDVSEAGGSVGYRKTLLQVTCLDGETVMLGFAREVGSKEDSFPPLKFIAAQEEFKLVPPAETITSGPANQRYDVRGATVPLQIFESAVADDRMELSGEVAGGKPVVIRVSTAGLPSALSSMTRRCYQDSLRGAMLVPRQTP